MLDFKRRRVPVVGHLEHIRNLLVREIQTGNLEMYLC